MTTGAAPLRRHGAVGVGPIVWRSEDHWLRYGASTAHLTPAAVAILLASMALHTALVATAFLAERPVVSRLPQEVEVELVQAPPKAEAPKPAPRPAADATPKPAETVPPPPLRREPVTEPKDEAPAPKPPLPQSPPPVEADAQKLQALQDELNSLRSERAALQAERNDAQAPPPAARGQGPMPDSFESVALPTTTGGIGDAAGYQEIVFSELAKAKGIGRQQGIPGTAGVRFEIDEAGRLVDVAIVRPSGVASLDADALAIVRRAAPFPPPPQGAQRSFVANVNFVAQP